MSQQLIVYRCIEINDAIKSKAVKEPLKEKGVNRLVAVMANNDELIDNLILILDVVNGLYYPNDEIE